MSNKPTIQILAEKVIEASGVDWQLTHAGLRTYVHSLSDVDFLAEIVEVTNPAIFFILWSVGLSQRRQDICTQRERELK